jgi:uncharacterized protein (DUF2461 family)
MPAKQKSADTAIPPSAFHFLRALARNNNRPWFNANKDRYLAELRDPLLRFIAAFAPRLRKIHPGMVADPSPAGGSLFRIYRDTRFAKDKSRTRPRPACSSRFRAGASHLRPASICTSRRARSSWARASGIHSPTP